MKKTFLQGLELFAGLLAIPLAAYAGPALETRLWHADNGQDAALVSGAELSLDAPARLHLRASYAQGTFNSGGDIEKLDLARGLVTRTDGPLEWGVGYAWVGYDTELQPGWAWSYPDEERERNADAHGPVLHARIAQPLGNGAWGLRAAGTWMVVDLGDFDELGYDGAHLDLETGVTYTRTRLQAGLGYRWLLFRDLPPRLENERTFSRNRTDGALLHLTFFF